MPLKRGTIEERAMEIERDIGPIEVVVYNLGAQIGDRNLQATSYRAFEMGWRLATFRLVSYCKCGHAENGGKR